MPTTTKIDLSSVAVRPPAIPDKMDIIPIHTSDRATFKRCRRKWDYSSPMRRNLRQKVSQSGIYFPLWFGSGVHYALAQFYNPLLRRDPVEAFVWWYQLQWEGGVIKGDQLELVYDPKPRPRTHGVYEVFGLRDLHPDPNPEEFEAHRELGIGMMEFYKNTYVPAEDNFAVIVEEHTFSVPVGITAIDPRDGVRKEVHYRGRQDAIIQDLETGRFGILEHKTAASIDEDYRRKLEKDEQVTSYMWAAEREAAEYGLEYGNIEFTLYNMLRKAYPKPPTMTTKGLFSINRSEESTTIDLLKRCIEENNLQVIVDTNEKLQAYVEYVREAGYKQFVDREMVYRNRKEIDSCGTRLLMEITDMLGLPYDYLQYGKTPIIRPYDENEQRAPLIYPNPTGDFLCLKCPFRIPCIAADDGSDVETILRDNYEKNVDR